MFIVTVTFAINQDNVTEFVEIMKKQAYNSLKNEEGCMQFDVCQDPEDARRIFLYEVYIDSDAFDVHLKTDHFLDFDASVRNWTESKTAEQWHRIVG